MHEHAAAAEDKSVPLMFALALCAMGWTWIAVRTWRLRDDPFALLTGRGPSGVALAEAAAV